MDAMKAPPGPRLVPEGVPMGDGKASKPPPWPDIGVPRAGGVPMGELRVAGAKVEAEGPAGPLDV